jgi:hypothetical protein
LLAPSAFALTAGATGASASAGHNDGDWAPQLDREQPRTVSGINGKAGKHADVDSNSSCSNPDPYDKQTFSTAASGNPATTTSTTTPASSTTAAMRSGKHIGADFESSGTCHISACPAGTGPDVARLRDLKGDGRNDNWFQDSY